MLSVLYFIILLWHGLCSRKRKHILMLPTKLIRHHLLILFVKGTERCMFDDDEDDDELFLWYG